MKPNESVQLRVNWNGNLGSGTSSYKAYARSYEILALNKPVIVGSSDPEFCGDRSKWNPEELLLSSISSCHMLWYLHFCADNKIIVEKYTDSAAAIMQIEASGTGKFIEATLNPKVKLTDPSQINLAIELHHKAYKFCFIANSLNFKIQINPEIITT